MSPPHPDPIFLPDEAGELRLSPITHPWKNPPTESQGAEKEIPAGQEGTGMKDCLPASPLLGMVLAASELPEPEPDAGNKDPKQGRTGPCEPTAKFQGCFSPRSDWTSSPEFLSPGELCCSPAQNRSHTSWLIRSQKAAGRPAGHPAFQMGAAHSLGLHGPSADAPQLGARLCAAAASGQW